MVSRVDTLLSNILISGQGKSFYRFANADGKEWIMPAENMRLAMNLYQPSGRNGKLLKTLFPSLHWCCIIRKVLHAKKIRCDLRPDLYKLLCDKFSETDLEYAIFGGTPCVHQKITIQVSKNKKILGYCKICSNQDVYSLFESEKEVLTELHSKNVENIPECLYCGHLGDGVGVFIQTTIKTSKSKSIHEWNSLVENFIDDFYNKTKQTILFEDSDFCKSLLSLKSHLDRLPDIVNSQVISDTLDKVLLENKNKKVEYAAYHADFTPWNMFVESGNLFAFDFEYAGLTFPIGLDRYHFFTQISIFEKHWDFDAFIVYINANKGIWINRDKYIFYLLEIMYRFVVRSKGNYSIEEKRLFQLWFNLLKYLVK